MLTMNILPTRNELGKLFRYFKNVFFWSWCAWCQLQTFFSFASSAERKKKWWGSCCDLYHDLRARNSLGSTGYTYFSLLYFQEHWSRFTHFVYTFEVAMWLFCFNEKWWASFQQNLSCPSVLVCINVVINQSLNDRLQVVSGYLKFFLILTVTNFIIVIL